MRRNGGRLTSVNASKNGCGAGPAAKTRVGLRVVGVQWLGCSETILELAGEGKQLIDLSREGFALLRVKGSSL
jgi:hypothetical protein